MAGRPDIDTGQLEKANKIMGDIVSKFDMLARIDEIPALALLKNDLDPVDKKLDKITKAVSILSKKGGKDFKQFADEIKKTNKQLESLKKEEERLIRISTARGKQTIYEKDRLTEINKERNELEKHLKEELKLKTALLKLSGQMAARGADWIGGSAMSMGFSTVFAGLKQIATGIERVYDLQEKWTAAIGTFRRSIGPATKDSQLFEKTAAELRGTLANLGMEFGQSFEEMSQFVHGFGFANDEASKWAKNAIEMGIATGAGTSSIAELSKTMMLMGTDSKKSRAAFQEMIDAARAAGLSTADFTKEMAGAKESVAEFGETGRSMFLGAAAWAKKLGVSIKSLQNMIKLTDTFESTANAAAKLNTVFGTSINSMDLMLEQDPAKRFNMLRDSLIGVGKDMKNLSRQEKQLISETLGMSIEETNAFLKSGKEYNKFISDKQEQEEKSAKNTKIMNEMMARAATTMYSWSELAVRIIDKFKPVVDLFLKGLGPGFESVAAGAQTFGAKIEEVMDMIVKNIMGDNGAKKTITDLAGAARNLFNEILKPENITSFVNGLKGLFTMFGRMVAWLTNMASSPAIKFVAKLVEWLGSIGHIVAGAWAGMKAGAAIGSVIPGVGTVVGAVGGAIIGAGGAAVAGSMMSAADDQDTKIKAKQEKNPGMSRVEALNAVAADEEAAANGSADGSGMWTGGRVRGGRRPITVGEHGKETFLPAGGGSIIPQGGLAVAAAAPIILKLSIDSREIQRIPFDATFPVNVSVVGA